jgi:AcrR family transcriptional regulator
MVDLRRDLSFVNTVAYGATMRPANTNRNTSTSTRIGRGDWIRGALTLLLEGGIEAVRVEPLALRLGVTKGSFYWHFKDRAALHAAMIEDWRDVGTRNIRDHVERSGGDARAKLRRLIGIATLNPKAAALETAMRGWARHDLAAAEALAVADHERVSYVSGLLRELGIKQDEADVRSRIVYLALIGSYFAAGNRKLARQDVWRAIERLIAP